MPGRTVEARVGDWHRAYQAIALELVPSSVREAITALGPTNPTAASLLRHVASMDRCAALCAAVLTQSGVRPLPVEAEAEDTDDSMHYGTESG